MDRLSLVQKDVFLCQPQKPAPKAAVIGNTALNETIVVTARDSASGVIVVGDIKRAATQVGRTGVNLVVTTGVSLCPPTKPINCVVVPLPKSQFDVLVPGYDVANFFR